MRHIVLLLLAASLSALVQPRLLASSRGGAFDFGALPPSSVCATEDVWQSKAQQLGLHDKRDGCPLEGGCDDPAQRDAAPLAPFTVSIIVHVMRTSAGVAPNGVDASVIDGQIALLNQHYAPYSISFDLLDVQFHDDDQFHCISPLSYFNQNYLLDIQAMKDAYATQWTQALNVFVSCQSSSIFGVLGGFAVFPWDPDALTARGGLWMNADYFGSDQSVLTHELGHCLGLYHPHRGVAETAGCTDPCAENVHAADDPLADLVGDFCKDTPATPANGTCADPAGADCDSVAWVDTDYTNFMGYAPETCVDHFSSEQVQRMHCWARDAMAPVLDDQLVVAHVASIQLTSQALNSNTRRGRASITIVDAGGVPVPGVTVNVQWGDSYEGPGSALTDGSGQAVLTTPWVTAPVFCWSVRVTGLEGAAVAYDPTANVVTEATAGKGCSGGPIVVELPIGRDAPTFDGTRPNPFNPSTTIRFRLPSTASVSLDVVDVAGRVVARLLETSWSEGAHEIVWHGLDDAGRPAASGVYYAVLRTPDAVTTQRLVLLK